MDSWNKLSQEKVIATTFGKFQKIGKKKGELEVGFTSSLFYAQIINNKQVHISTNLYTTHTRTHKQEYK